ncbi:MAG: YHS domain-containing protein [Chitinivibrionales bacterium]|nr:YHS domain-containing protein [Chitinivibrionales bacterium]
MKAGVIFALAVVLTFGIVAVGCSSSEKKASADSRHEVEAEGHGAHAHHDHARHGGEHGHEVQASGDHSGHDHSAPKATGLVPQKTCPVMGAAIDTSIYVDHDGKRVYFCCQSCIDTFKANPDRYLEKLEELGEKPAEL